MIFGGGYAVQILESLNWLESLDVVYWGDLDTHGFAILNRLRHRFPNARSLLMDSDTLLAHQTQWVTEPTPTAAVLSLLTPDEQALYGALGAGVFGPAVRLGARTDQLRCHSAGSFPQRRMTGRANLDLAMPIPVLEKRKFLPF